MTTRYERLTEDRSCSRGFCTCAIATILVGLLTATIGLIVGIFLAASLTAALPAIFAFGGIILVLLIIKLIYDFCRCRDK